MAADWSCLPIDLVRQIANKLPAVEDFSVLTAVCRSYRSALDKKQWRPEGCSRPPWLLLCCQGGGDPPTSERGFLNLYKNNKRFVMNLPEIHGRRCWGSPYGWIVTIGLDQKLHLFNPLNSRRILLPQTICKQVSRWVENKKARYMRKLHIDRAILIKRPPYSYSSSGFDDFLVVTVRRHEIRVIRPHSWEPVKFFFMENSSPLVPVFDIAFYNGQIYILSVYAQLFICSNFDGPDPPTAHEYTDTLLDDGTPIYDGDEEEDDGSPSYFTALFKAYKLNHDTKEWIELEDLGDCAIFVGDCQSISLSLSQPEKFGCRRNCIYFTDDCYIQDNCISFTDDSDDNNGGHDMGIYDFGKMTTQPLYDGADSRSTYSSPTWLLPCFN